MGSDEEPRDYEIARRQFKIGYAIASVTGALVVILIFIWIFRGEGISWDKHPINIHIMLSIFFAVYLHAHGAMMFRLLPEKPKPQVKLLHAGIHFSVVLAMGFGLICGIQHQSIKGRPNFFTMHSWIGLLSIIMYYGQFLAGFSMFLLPWAPVRMRMSVLPFHQALGPLIFLGCTLAAATGIMMKALGSGAYDKEDYGDAIVLNLAGLFLLIFSCTVLWLLMEYRFRRRPRPEEPENEEQEEMEQ